MRNRGGWVFMDILVGLLLLSLIGIMLGAGAAWHAKALARLADSRAASRLAEFALISLQAGEHPDSSNVSYHRLSSSSDIPRMTWVQVTASINGRSATLVGLVPEKSLPSGGGS